MAAQQLSEQNGKIRLVSLKRETASLLVPDRYELNLKGRLPWLQKLLFTVLRYLKAESYDTSVTYKHTEIDTSKILDALMQNVRDVEMLYYKRARYVVMGVDAFARMSNEPHVHQMMRFDFTARVGLNRQITALGLEVIVVPWIEGFFVLPDLEQPST